MTAKYLVHYLAILIQKNRLIDGIFFENPGARELYFTPTDLISALGLRKVEKAYLTRTLKREMKMQPLCQTKYVPGDLRDFGGPKVNGRPYLFKRPDPDV